ncbi:MAG: hypothetical protein Q9221_003281 [Calogaya cf. arnoldii]
MKQKVCRKGMARLRRIFSRALKAIRQLFEPHPIRVQRPDTGKTEFVSISSESAPADQDLHKEAFNSNAIEESDTEATDLYVIYAQDVSVKSQAEAINQLLERLVSDKSTIYASEVNDIVNGKDMWTLFWGVNLTASQAEQIKADPNQAAPSSTGKPLTNGINLSVGQTVGLQVNALRQRLARLPGVTIKETASSTLLRELVSKNAVPSWQEH